MLHIDRTVPQTNYDIYLGEHWLEVFECQDDATARQYANEMYTDGEKLRVVNEKTGNEVADLL